MELKELTRRTSMYDIIGKAKYFGALSVILVLVSIGGWFAFGLNLGIDFTGGTALQVHFPSAEQLPAITEVEEALTAVGVEGARVQTADTTDYVIKMQQISNDQRQLFLDAFAEQDIEEESYSSVGPTLGSELKRKAVLALVLVLLAIIGFVSYAFRAVSKASVPSWVFGLAAIVALMHDTILILGTFIFLGYYLDVQIDAYFVTALLTVLGFSVNDTIVVFDRIRESVKRHKKKSFEEVINMSINSTMVRSLNTSLTTLVVLTALFLFGGASIQYLILALILGIIFGTYSSIFIASPLLLIGKKLLKK